MPCARSAASGPHASIAWSRSSVTATVLRGPVLSGGYITRIHCVIFMRTRTGSASFAFG